MKKPLLFLLLLAPGVRAAASTAPVTMALVLERFEDMDRRLTTLSADFRQSVRWEESGATQSVEGRLDYRKKDRLRLEHRLPERQTIVADGQSLWIWRRSTNQVIQTRLKEWKQSEPLAQGLMDFGGYSELLKRYEATLSSSPTIILTLTPKEKKKDFTLTLKLSPENYFPYDTEMRVGEVSVHSIFENVRFNPELPDSLFRFTPPPGADVFVKPPKEPHGP
jgi:outer membrane lipoprotein carrier protein